MEVKLVGRAFDWLQTLLAVALVVAVALNFAAVVGRYLLGVAVVGTDELQIFLMVWMAFLGAAIVTWREKHLRMDVLSGFLPRRARAAVRRAEAAVLLVLACVVVWESAGYVRQMIALGRQSDAAGIPMAVPHAAVTIGFALIALIAAVRLGRRADDETERS
jgi:TRAP-type C4-dicarboxylate transport system permease small subunit